MAQLGARLNGIQKVSGSNPLSSTNKKTAFEGGFFILCLSHLADAKFIYARYIVATSWSWAAARGFG